MARWPKKDNKKKTPDKVQSATCCFIWVYGTVKPNSRLCHWGPFASDVMTELCCVGSSEPAVKYCHAESPPIPPRRSR